LDNPDEAKIDWAAAEELAFATILEDGTPIRLTGQDTERGTFSQRHAVFFDVETNRAHVPLQSFPQAGASFEVLNSPLSEAGAIGFEVGYNIMAPERLDIWEAQYGDFINNAQTVIDEFLLSGRAKWGLTPSLVLLLPHGNEGQGPDHSSGNERPHHVSLHCCTIFPFTASSGIAPKDRSVAIGGLYSKRFVASSPSCILLSRIYHGWLATRNR
jgi:2-oxoglutarate dehydrogenase complex dehydrogenase (E1) component-like enzyme